jgi:hypothetical protein
MDASPRPCRALPASRTAGDGLRSRRPQVGTRSAVLGDGVGGFALALPVLLFEPDSTTVVRGLRFAAALVTYLPVRALRA